MGEELNGFDLCFESAAITPEDIATYFYGNLFAESSRPERRKPTTVIYSPADHSKYLLRFRRIITDEYKIEIESVGGSDELCEYVLDGADIWIKTPCFVKNPAYINIYVTL
jgi:hypothetical protein